MVNLNHLKRKENKSFKTIKDNNNDIKQNSLQRNEMN